jgi:uncharacterized protein (DUF433 family)
MWPLATADLHNDGKLVAVKEKNGVWISALPREHTLIAGTFIDLKAVRGALAAGGWVALQTPREHIEVDPERLSGRPTVRGHRIATEVVADMATRPEGRELLTEDFGLTDEEIAEAVAYEADVREAVAA